jgi:predicted NUDIX family NTP pyrophosphohydrolase
MPAESAGILAYRRSARGIEVLLAHPGGPYFKNKDAGAWSIPKGEVANGELYETTARREFKEELGVEIAGELLPLGSVKQKSGKVVHAFATPLELAADFVLTSNEFEIEWPPRSGKRRRFPEIDRAEFFSLTDAASKILAAQAPLLARLGELLEPTGRGG